MHQEFTAINILKEKSNLGEIFKNCCVCEIESISYDFEKYDNVAFPTVVKLFSKKKQKPSLKDYKEAIDRMFYDENVHIGPWAKLYKREVFEKERFKSCYCEDADILERIIKKDQSILYISDSLFKYRIRNDADTWVFKPRTYEQIAVFDNMYLFAKENYPSELIGALKAKMMSVWFHVLLQLPKGDKRADELKKRIKENRRAVLKDNRIRNKTRIACLSSYLGFSVVRLLFGFVKRAG